MTTAKVIPGFPTADQIARAVVAACRETDEDPETIVSDTRQEFRARHYALHALVHVFPGAGVKALSACLGAPGNPSFFYRSSLWYVLGQGPKGDKPKHWWSDDTLGRVVAALQTCPAPARPTAHLEPKASPAPALRPVQHIRNIAEAIEPAPIREAVVKRTPWDAGRNDRVPIPAGKRSLQDMLAEAVRNTQAMPDKGGG